MHVEDITSKSPIQHTSAFGTHMSDEYTPVIQGDFVTGINSQIWQYSYVFTVTAPGVAPVFGDKYTNNNADFIVVYSSGTTLVCFGTANPAASGNLTRASGSGSTPIAYSAYTTQAGVTFGTGAAIDTNAGRLRLQSGTGSTNYAYLTTRDGVRYRAGEGTEYRFTAPFASPIANNTQLQGIGTVVNGAPYDGYFFGSIGTSFGIAHYNAGTLVGGSIVTQTNWNGDKINGSAGSSFTIDPTFGTPLIIKYPYLGYGDVHFLVEHPTTGAVIRVHTITYANTTASTQLGNPTLSPMAYIANSGNTTNKTMYSGSIGAFITGKRSFVSNPKWAVDGSKSGITTETCIVNIKNCNSYNGSYNRGLMRLNSFSFSCTATSASTVFIRFKIGSVIGGTSTYTAIAGTSADNGTTITAGTSIGSYDTAGTTVSGGTYVFNLSASAGQNGSGGQSIDLTPFDIFISPNEVLSVTASSSNSATIGISLNGTDDI